MIKQIIYLFFCFLFLEFFLVKTVTSELKINELFPRPSPGVDWVEFYNDSDQVLDITQYKFYDSAGNEKKFDCQLINPKGFVTVDWGNTLNNAGDTIFLKKNNEIIDCISYGDGDKKDCGVLLPTRLPTPPFNQSIARASDGANIWIITHSTKDSPNDGSLKMENAICFNPTPTLTPTPTSILTPTLFILPSFFTPTPIPSTFSLTIISYEKVFISEVMTNPLTGEKEWVEIYNDNDFEVFLDNWFIDDIENGGSSPRSFSITISPKSYGVIELASAMFNNNGDNVRLLDFDKKLKDSFEYNLSVQGKTFGRVSFENDNFCLQEPTKGKPNNLCINFNVEEKTTTSLIISPSLVINQFDNLKKSTPSLTVSFTDDINKNNLFFNSSFIRNNNSENKENGEVLGLKKKKINKRDFSSKKSKSANTLSFLSLNYSLLSFTGLLLKIVRRMKDL